MIQHGPQIILLAAPAVVYAAASSGPAEVEAQDRDSGGDDRLGRRVNHLVVHRASEQGVGMAHDRRGPGLLVGPFQHALDPAGRPGNEEALDPAHDRPADSCSARRARRVT